MAGSSGELLRSRRLRIQWADLVKDHLVLRRRSDATPVEDVLLLVVTDRRLVSADITCHVLVAAPAEPGEVRDDVPVELDPLVVAPDLRASPDVVRVINPFPTAGVAAARTHLVLR